MTDQEWKLLELWQSRGEVEFYPEVYIGPLTDDPRQNALLVAQGIRYHRSRGSESQAGPPPRWCRDVAGPSVEQLADVVSAGGPIKNWTRVDPNERIRYVMRLLVNRYGFQPNGAAGLVGNLTAESQVLPTKIQETEPLIPEAGPLTERDSLGQVRTFTAEEVMNLDPRRRPELKGIGLAQWTWSSRREGLFEHRFERRRRGAAILFDMEAQVDYLVSELESKPEFKHVYALLRRAGVAVHDASDKVLLHFERPKWLFDENGNLRPLDDPAILEKVDERKKLSDEALRTYNKLLRKL